MGRDEYESRIARALRFIEERYGDDIGLAEISEAARFSPYHFHRVFSALHGESPLDYLRRIRLERAAALLAIQPERSITDIAMECGFSSPSVFARSFRVRFGRSARAFRLRGKPAGAPAARPLLMKGMPASAGAEPVGRYAFLSMRSLPAMRMACARSMTGYGPGIGRAWRRLLPWAHAEGLVNGGARFFGMPLDDPRITPAGKCRYLVAMPIPSGTEPGGAIELFLYDASWCAEFFYEGPGQGFQDFYDWVYGRWLPENGSFPEDRPALEEYGIDAISSASAPKGEFRFRLYLPLRGA